MSSTRPTGEQIEFNSAKTGAHVLDDYLEAAERGNKTLADITGALFSDTGDINPDFLQVRVNASGVTQIRLGEYLDPEAGWHDLMNIAGSVANAAASATAAANSATTATTQASTAVTQASTATTQATAAANSATSAAASATTATTKAENASISATSAANSATSASGSAATANTKANEAAASATSSANSAVASALSATAAAGSATTATTQAENASTSATNAAASAASAASAAASISGGPVTSVNSKTGVVTLAKSDIGLGNVDNTSDANKPVSTAQQLALNDKLSKSGDSLTGALNEAPAATMASGATTSIGTANANTLNITGTATITSFDVAAAGVKRRLIFAGACTLTHNATSLILPGAENIITAAGDVAEMLSLGSGNWKCVGYQYNMPPSSRKIGDVIFTSRTLSAPEFLPANGSVYAKSAYHDLSLIASYTSEPTTKLASPATLPAGFGYGVAFSADGKYMAVAHGAAPFITIYKRSGDTFTKLADPATLPASDGMGVAFSADGTYMAVAHYTTYTPPFITIYKRSGDTFTKLADPETPPVSDCYGVAFSADGTYLAVAHTTLPFITIYKRSGDTFTKLANPATLPAGDGRGVALSADGKYMAVAHYSPPFITIYKRSGDTFTKLADPETLPASDGNGVAFYFGASAYMDRFMAVAHYSPPFITIYRDGYSYDPNTEFATPNYSSVVQAGTTAYIKAI